MQFEAIGTHWEIETPAFDDASTQHVFEAQLRKFINQFEHYYSRFQTDSVIVQIEKQAGAYHFPEEDALLFSMYAQMHEVTAGKFTLLVGQTLQDLGYDRAYSLREKKKIFHGSNDSAFFSYDHPTLTVKQPISLDFGGLGKGWMIDRISALLAQLGAKEYTIHGSGDLRVSGRTTPLRIALEHPLDHTKAVGIAQHSHGAFAGSSGSRRQWRTASRGTVHHIIDPETGRSPTQVLASWVSAETALVADAVATALFFTPAETLRRAFDFEYALLTEQQRIEKSSAFPAEFFIQ